MATKQLDLFTEQSLKREPEHTTDKPATCNDAKIKQSPMDINILQYLIGKDVLSDTTFTDVGEASSYYFEGYWQTYQRENDIYVDGEKYKTEQDVFDAEDKYADHFFTTFVRVFMAMQEVLDKNFNTLMTPEQYVSDIYSVYAREECLNHTKPIPYFQWRNYFDGWVRYKKEVIYTQYMFNC